MLLKLFCSLFLTLLYGTEQGGIVVILMLDVGVTLKVLQKFFFIWWVRCCWASCPVHWQILFFSGVKVLSQGKMQLLFVIKSGCSGKEIRCESHRRFSVSSRAESLHSEVDMWLGWTRMNSKQGKKKTFMKIILLVEKQRHSLS